MQLTLKMILILYVVNLFVKKIQILVHQPALWWSFVDQSINQGSFAYIFIIKSILLSPRMTPLMRYMYSSLN